MSVLTAHSAVSPEPVRRAPIRYRNHFRWRVMPPDGADEQGFLDHSFGNKKQALAYQKKVKAKFPNSLVRSWTWAEGMTPTDASSATHPRKDLPMHVETPTQSTTLYYRDHASDKVYHVSLDPSGDLFLVNFAYGRRGSTLNTGTKTSCPVDYDEAKRIYDKLVREKQAKGYSAGPGGEPYQHTDKAGRFIGILPQLLNPVEEHEVDRLATDPARKNHLLRKPLSRLRPLRWRPVRPWKPNPRRNRTTPCQRRTTSRPCPLMNAVT